jgi:hypothetical protein
MSQHGKPCSKQVICAGMLTLWGLLLWFCCMQLLVPAPYR